MRICLSPEFHSMAKLSTVKVELSSLLLSRPRGLTQRELDRDYRQSTGRQIPYRELGFSSLQRFIQSIPDTIYTLYSSNGEEVLHSVPTTESQHVEKLIRRQKDSSKKRRTRPAYYSYSPLSMPYPARLYQQPLFPPPTRSFSAHATVVQRSQQPPRFHKRPISQPRPSVVPVSVEANILKILALFKEGLKCEDLQDVYLSRFGRNVDFRGLGFDSLALLIKSISDSVDVQLIPGRGFTMFAKRDVSHGHASEDETPVHQLTKEVPSPSIPAMGDVKGNGKEDEKQEIRDSGDGMEERHEDKEKEGDLFHDLQDRVWNLLMGYTNGVWAMTFLQMYQDTHNGSIPYEDFGFQSAIDLLKALSGIVDIQQPVPDGDYILFPLSPDDGSWQQHQTIFPAAISGTEVGDSSSDGTQAEWIPQMPEISANHTYESVTVSYITNKSLLFYVQIPTQDQGLMHLQERLQLSAPREKTVSSVIIKKAYCARYHDNKWYRVIVQEIKEGDQAEVFFCDYGNKELVPFNNLKPIDPSYLSIELFAVQASLSCIKPSSGEWSSDDVFTFSRLVDGKKFKIHVNGVEDDVLQIDSITCGSCDVIDALISSGSASYCVGFPGKPGQAVHPFKEEPQSVRNEPLLTSFVQRPDEFIQNVELPNNVTGHLVHVNGRVYLPVQDINQWALPYGQTAILSPNSRLFQDLLKCYGSSGQAPLSLIDVNSLPVTKAMLERHLDAILGCVASPHAAQGHEQHIAELQSRRAYLIKMMSERTASQAKLLVDEITRLEKQISELRLGDRTSQANAYNHAQFQSGRLPVHSRLGPPVSNPPSLPLVLPTAQNLHLPVSGSQLPYYPLGRPHFASNRMLIPSQHGRQVRLGNFPN